MMSSLVAAAIRCTLFGSMALKHAADVIHARLSKPEIAQGRVIVGAAIERPMVLALVLLDRQVVDAGDGHSHQAVLVELLILIVIAAELVPRHSDFDRLTVSRLQRG
jgi:hypothetical protein